MTKMPIESGDFDHADTPVPAASADTMSAPSDGQVSGLVDGPETIAGPREDDLDTTELAQRPPADRQPADEQDRGAVRLQPADQADAAIATPDSVPAPDERALRQPPARVQADAGRIALAEDRSAAAPDEDATVAGTPDDGMAQIERELTGRIPDEDLRVVPDEPFISEVEQQAHKSDAQLEQEVADKHALLQDASHIGDRVRLAAMDKTPDNAGTRKPTQVTWEASDERLPGSAYRYTADFQRRTRDGPPELRSVTCSFIADTAAERDRGTRNGQFGQNATTHPLSVTAEFDGPQMTGLKLEWPNRSRIRATEAQLGPAWRDEVTGNRGALLPALIREVDGQRQPAGLDGYIQLRFDDQPTLETGTETRWYDPGRFPTGPQKAMFTATAILNPVAAPVYWLSRRNEARNMGKMYPQRPVSGYQYIPSTNSYTGQDSRGRIHNISADDVLHLSDRLTRFFPIFR